MAGREPSTTRRRVLGAAAALPITVLASPVIARSGATKQSSVDGPGLDCVAPLAMTWDRRLARYQRLTAEAEEAAETGWFREANDRFEREGRAIGLAFADRETIARAPEAEALRAEAWDRMAAAEETYWERCTEPMQKAGVLLALTPAPDLAAVIEKVRMMRRLHLHELDRMPYDCFSVLEEDVGRLLAL